MSIAATARTIALGGVILALGACGGWASSAPRLSAGIARNPGWTEAQLNRAYAEWANDVKGETSEEPRPLPGGDAGGDGDGAPPGNAEPPVSRAGLTEAGQVLLLCEFNTASLYVTYAQFQTMDGAQRRELRRSVRQACLA